ncbi:MAG TPA: LytTR family DNA-binding domain-containing protein [Gemmatimonadales bacterium]|nr:LytTR family DNA-binding domain-containing protein [Gemmatimonadales bacterium]
MAELRALVVDDEPLARRGVRQLLGAHPDITVAREARDGREALQALATDVFDLVFLDIQMPGLDGLAVIRQHGVQRMPPVVFVTAHDQFAVRAFDAQALDYLVKPIGAARFDATIARVRERLRLESSAARAQQLAALLGAAVPEPPAPADRRVAVTAGDRQLLLDPEEIDWIEADDYHVTIHVRDQSYRVRSSLSAMADRLDPGRFLRVHRSALVAMDRIRELLPGSDDADAIVVLRTGRRLPVSRRRLPELRRRLRPTRR